MLVVMTAGPRGLVCTSVRVYPQDAIVFQDRMFTAAVKKNTEWKRQRSKKDKMTENENKKNKKKERMFESRDFINADMTARSQLKRTDTGGVICRQVSAVTTVIQSGTCRAPCSTSSLSLSLCRRCHISNEYLSTLVSPKPPLLLFLLLSYLLCCARFFLGPFSCSPSACLLLLLPVPSGHIRCPFHHPRVPPHAIFLLRCLWPQSHIGSKC